MANTALANTVQQRSKIIDGTSVSSAFFSFPTLRYGLTDIYVRHRLQLLRHIGAMIMKEVTLIVIQLDLFVVIERKIYFPLLCKG